MRRRTTVLAAGLFTALLAVPTSVSASGSGRTMVEFDTMAPVTEPFTGPANPIRDVPGGGLPWEIDEASGELRTDGRLEVEVEGLVLARRAPVPAERQGTNPVPSFKAIVSCVTADAGTATTVNVSTGLAAASSTGDARIDTTVELPETCIAPVVFVTSPDGAWFAASGH
jgi:hypothetical protein